MSLYLDASVLVPLVVPEDHSDRAHSFVSDAEDPLMVSTFAAGEVSSAIARLFRMERLTEDQAKFSFDRFDAWRAGVTETVPIEQSDFEIAQLFVREIRLGLRMPDALHAAVSLRNQYTLVTFDEHLARAARGLGITVEVPA